MSASAVIAASAIAVSETAAAATSSPLIPALIGVAGVIVGAGIAQLTALSIAYMGRADARQRDAATKQHALRTLAAEKRLDAHQKAFLNVKRMLAARENSDVIQECRNWMDEHCLYLTIEARKAVWEAIGYAEARIHHIEEAGRIGADRDTVRSYREAELACWNGILASLEPIVSGVELPRLGLEEVIVLSEKNQR